ncbi:restriction endonuclease subunit S, partial [Capnocytophaga canis]|uniref:restriction endonuclease subunit S n=1 Tax=Capnocytophaga canis TaxID=1848903 RepID=UPI0018CD6793
SPYRKYTEHFADGTTKDITEEIPFEIPENWAWCRLGEVCEFENGFAFNSNDYKKEEGIPLIRISNIQNGTINLDEVVLIDKKIDEKFIVKKGDLLIAMSGATTGKMGNYTFKEKAYLNQRVGNIRIRNKDVLHSKYRDFFMLTKSNDILKMAYGGAQPNISGKMINSLSIPLPPLSEQKRIVAKVEELLALVEDLETN